jgi:hypothetical protein
MIAQEGSLQTPGRLQLRQKRNAAPAMLRPRNLSEQLDACVKFPFRCIEG